LKKLCRWHINWETAVRDLLRPSPPDEKYINYTVALDFHHESFQRSFVLCTALHLNFRARTLALCCLCHVLRRNSSDRQQLFQCAFCNRARVDRVPRGLQAHAYSCINIICRSTCHILFLRPPSARSNAAASAASCRTTVSTPRSICSIALTTISLYTAVLLQCAQRIPSFTISHSKLVYISSSSPSALLLFTGSSRTSTPGPRTCDL
jgi:hypothetical protein